MTRVPLRWFALLIGAAGGCNDIGDGLAKPCRADMPDGVVGTDCHSAKELARRASTDFVVSQEELDRYLDIYERGFVPLERYLGAPPGTSSWTPTLTAVTTADRFTEPWLRGVTETGLPLVDDVVRRAHIDVVTPLGMMNGPYFALSSSTHVVVSRNVALALQGAPDLQVSATQARPPEGAGFTDVFIDEADDRPGDTVIVYRLGWGDCFVECSGQVSWRVRVTDTTATLLSSWVWGEPPPPHILEFWRTIEKDR